MQTSPFKLEQSYQISKRTTEGLTVLECCCKLWPHFDDQVLAFLLFGLPIGFGISDHLIHPRFIQCEKHVADPLLVQGKPVPFIWEVIPQISPGLHVVQKVFAGKAFNLGDSCNLNICSLDVLIDISNVVLPLWRHERLVCRKRHWCSQSWAGKPCSPGIGSRRALSCYGIVPSPHGCSPAVGALGGGSSSFKV